MIFTIALWVHLVAAVIWIGGMLFLVTVLRPVVMGNKKETCGGLQEMAIGILFCSAWLRG